MVYLPAGADWYNYWTNQRIHGGQSIQVDAPIDTLPLFVRAGSLVPLGAAVESTSEVQKIAKVRVYAGADGNFALYQDDGRTYAYEKGGSSLTQLHWDDAGQKLTHDGTQAWAGSDAEMVEIAGHLGSLSVLRSGGSRETFFLAERGLCLEVLACFGRLLVGFC